MEEPGFPVPSLIFLISLEWDRTLKPCLEKVKAGLGIISKFVAVEAVYWRRMNMESSLD